jgi:hypothetical protein
MYLHEALKSMRNEDAVSREGSSKRYYVSDNVISYLREEGNNQVYTPSVVEIKADDWQIIKPKPKVLSAEEWVEKRWYKCGEATKSISIESFKAGESNRDLLYAELMKRLNNYFGYLKYMDEDASIQ